MCWPSGENTGSVSMPPELVSRFAFEPSAPTRKSCVPPSRESATARLRPSGDQAGALFEPRKLTVGVGCRVSLSRCT